MEEADKNLLFRNLELLDRLKREHRENKILMRALEKYANYIDQKEFSRRADIKTAQRALHTVRVERTKQERIDNELNR